MLSKDCEFVGDRYCMCDACQSMRKMIEKLTELKGDDIMKKEEAKKVFEEMSSMLSGNMDKINKES